MKPVAFGKRGDFIDAHLLRQGLVSTVEGQAVSVSSLDDAFVVLALLNSQVFQYVINQYCGQHKYPGYVNLFPTPDFQSRELQLAGQRAREIVSRKELASSFDETAPLFVRAVDCSDSNSLVGVAALCERLRAEIAKLEADLNGSVFSAYLLHNNAREVIAAYCNNQPTDSLWISSSEGSYSAAHSVMSYAIGCVYGRWDIRFATGERQATELSDPFASLPVCAQGVLQEKGGVPAATAPEGYPLRIDWNGILIDDPDHSDDIVRRVREVVELIWKDQSDAIEQEACATLGVDELRDYFSAPGKGGFWDDHLSRYSKSRRKAPIYWLLQSSKKNYSLWLYYHRLDKDLLFKALVNYVEPKLRLEKSGLDTLRKQKAEAGDSSKEARRLAKELERHEDFLSELRDFEDKLRRAANLHLEPDLNDGVVLNIAPLWELVPWKEAENYWDELTEGEYEWSSISKQLRQKGLVK
jgi:hypothetical protein